jgi:hypothetical protein
MICYLKRRTQTEGVRQYGAKEVFEPNSQKETGGLIKLIDSE